ncbi:unnamed protein product, partial [Durusdinium trenchii]
EDTDMLELADHFGINVTMRGTSSTSLGQSYPVMDDPNYEARPVATPMTSLAAPPVDVPTHASATSGAVPAAETNAAEPPEAPSMEHPEAVLAAPNAPAL